MTATGSVKRLIILSLSGFFTAARLAVGTGAGADTAGDGGIPSCRAAAPQETQNLALSDRAVPQFLQNIMTSRYVYA